MLALLLGLFGLGCTGHGSRVVEIDFFGQNITVKDTVPPDDQGETKYARTFDEDGWKFLFGWLVTEEPDETGTNTPADSPGG